MIKNRILEKLKVDESLVAIRWALFQDYLKKIESIKEFKEEEYQDGFLNDIFVSCLGYNLKTTNPNDFNLEREKKNETDAKKADGVIYLDGEVAGVIELKDQKTKNLDKTQQQAFYYLSQHSKARYAIISNFDELRLYIDKSTAYERFYLFELNYEEFKKLHTLLSFESLQCGLTLDLWEKSNSFEQAISKELYKDFANFRLELFENISKNNETNVDLTPSDLLRLTQKLCDRIIFMLFAEDRGLLKSNLIKEIRQRHEEDIFGNSLYKYYKIYFEAINQGNEKLNIPKYNGGLFLTDDALDSLKIDDEVLNENVQKLSDYDFYSDISVNILGHIFEQSLTDLEELQASLANEEFDKSKSKRKKDGIFYTPEYITNYIVENTLGKMCQEKRVKLEIDEVIAPKNSKKLTKNEQKTKENLLSYKEWLLELKILDPACGSGAFLNQALEFLIKEHYRLSDELALFEDLFASYKVEEEILENNLYGVDINEDAVEIAKLSLWLRTAKRGRVLTRLADKIVCANSLLEMPFPENSFDVVIGNPPYGAKMQNDEQNHYEIKSKESAILFMQLSHQMLKTDGYHGFIIPKPFIYSSTWKAIKEKLFDEIYALVDCGKAWQEVKLEQVIYLLEKDKKIDSYQNFIVRDGEYIHIEDINKNYCIDFEFLLNSVNSNEIDLAQKIKKDKLGLGYISQSNWGDTFYKEIRDSGDRQVLAGANIQKYELRGIKGCIYNGLQFSNNALIRKNSILLQRLIAHILNPIDHIKITGTIVDDYNEYLIVNTIQQVSLVSEISNRYILAIMHSKLMNWYVYRFIFAKAIRTFQFSNDVLRKIPIPKIEETAQQPFIALVDEILEAKQKIKDYKILLDEAIKNNSFDREIALKKELENLENICTTNENKIDQMVYELYDLTDDEIEIVER